MVEVDDFALMTPHAIRKVKGNQNQILNIIKDLISIFSHERIGGGLKYENIVPGSKLNKDDFPLCCCQVLIFFQRICCLESRF